MLLRRSRRDPESERNARVEALRDLLRGLHQLDPPNTGHPNFRTGTNVYISSERIGNAFVMADLLEILGHEKLARDLASFARGVERQPVKKQRNVTTPTWEKWRSLTRRIHSAIRQIMRGEDVREIAKQMATRPYLKLNVRRVHLNQGGYSYGRFGRYFGSGQPVYEVSSDYIEDDNQALIDHLRGKRYIDEHVRAKDAAEARRMIADRYHLRYTRH